jgi:hypothetical protein
MQLVQLSNTLKPLTLAVGVLSSVPIFAYSDIDNSDGMPIISNNRTLKYVRSVDKSDNAIWMHQFSFESYLTNWQQKTMFLSSTKSIVEDEDFQAIVSMGESAVPYIIAEIDTKPSTLVWALNFIYNKKITDNPDTTITEACKLWVKALKK